MPSMCFWAISCVPLLVPVAQAMDTRIPFLVRHGSVIPEFHEISVFQKSLCNTSRVTGERHNRAVPTVNVSVCTARALGG